MKVSSSKAISSPARTDKFPPPLMRFLRSNAGNRSSRRSRTSSPILILRRKNNNIETTTTQEPSSPKVTCMGQVKAKAKAKPKRETPSSTRCCWWIKKPKFRPSCLKWPIFRKKAKDSVNSEESNFKFHEQKVSSSVVDNGFAGNNSSTPPPGNALLLTRCRSAPYRSSSLASRFWSSPLRNNEESQGEKIDSSITNSEINGEALLSLKGREIVCDEVHPVMLTRCKSEPAGIGYRFDPAVEVEVEVEVNTSSSLLKLKKTSLAFVHTNTVSSPLHVHSD